MGVLESTMGFFTMQTTALTNFLTDTKSLALAGNFGWDEMVKRSAKFSAETAERWLGAFSAGTTPALAFATVGSAAGNYAGDSLTVPGLSNITTLQATLVPLNVQNPMATGTPACSLGPYGHLKIDVNNLSNLSANDTFLIIAYNEDETRGKQTLAHLVLRVV